MTSQSTPALAAQLKSQACTNFKLRGFLRRISQRYDEELAKAGLKTTQYSLLSHVQSLGPVRPVDLAKAMAMDASTLTRNLKPLIAAGWVDLGAGSDGRSRLVHITDSGRAKRAEAKQHWRVAQESINQLLGPERLLTLHALIDDSMALLAPDQDSGDDSE